MYTYSSNDKLLNLKPIKSNTYSLQMKLTDKKRQQIIQAAIDEFRQYGFTGTSMDKVAARAQVSKRTVYNHFTSKEELFSGIVGYMLELVSSAISAPYDPSQPIDSQLRKLALQEVELLKSQEFISLARMTIAETIHNPERMTTAIKQIECIESNMAGWFSSATEANQLSTNDPGFAATQFLGLIKSFCFWPQVVKGAPFPDEKQVENIIESAVVMFLRYYQKEK